MGDQTSETGPSGVAERPSSSTPGRAGWLAAVPGWGTTVAIITSLLAFLAATNHWMTFQAGLVYAHADDEIAYLKLAKAFPGFPDERIADQHTQRWPIHYFIGGIADTTGLGVETVYRVAAIALAFAMLLTAAAVLRRIGASGATVLVSLAVVALNPYALRYYGLAPAYLVDLVLDLGLALVLLGMVRRLPALVIAGLLIGTLARQTMLPVAPVVALWMALAPEWRDASGRIPRAWIAAAVLLPVILYAGAHAVAADFSRPGVPFSRLTILDAVLDLPSTAGDLLNHFAHIFNGLLAIMALLAATLMSTRLRELPALFWGSLAVGAVIVLQSAVLNPDPIFNDYSSSNEPRLVALAMIPLAVAFASARGWVEQRGVRTLAQCVPQLVAIVALMAIGSLHHIYTSVSTGSKGATLAIEVLTAAALLVLVLVVDRPGDGFWRRRSAAQS
jgi:hypothetical protein